MSSPIILVDLKYGVGYGEDRPFDYGIGYGEGDSGLYADYGIRDVMAKMYMAADITVMIGVLE